jgi:hypothetical protein
MAFHDSKETTSESLATSPDMVAKVLDVHIDQSNPLLSSMTVEAEAADNLGHYSGQYTVKMDDSKSMAQRVKFAEKARNEGGGFCGSLINDASARMKGRKLHFEGIKVTGENEATTSWIKSYRHDRLRRPGIVHTTEEPIRGVNNSDTGRKAAKVFAISVIDPEAFDVNDEARLTVLAQHADDNFKRATTPKDTIYNDRNVLRSSMPITEATFAILDNDSGEVLEYSGTFSKKTPTSPQSDAYPEHYSDSERVNSYTGHPVKLPRDGQDYLRLADEFKAYAASRYADRNVTPVCVESTRLMASTKIHQNPDMFYSVDVPEGKHPTPLQQLHQANRTEFLAEPGNDKARSRGVFHPDIRIQFAPNVGSTHSRYVRVDFNHIPDEHLNQPWIAACSFKGQALAMSPALLAPVANAVVSRAGQDVQSQAANHSQQQNPAANNAGTATPPSGHLEAPSTSRPVEASVNTPPPDDAAFDLSEALDDEAQRLNDNMAEYEQRGVVPSNTPTPAPEPQQNSPKGSQAPAQATQAPLPETNNSMDVSQLAYSGDHCPFDDMDLDNEVPKF